MGSLDNNIRLIRNETVEGGNTKERIAETFELLVTELESKVNKDANKGLSSNDFTNEHKQKLESLQPTDVSGLLPKGAYTGNASSLKADIDKKVDKVAGKGLSSNDYTNEEKRKNEENALKRVANITVTGDVNKIITITFADSTVMQAPFKDNDHISLADVHMNSLNFNENTGVLIGVKSDDNEISVSLDGRYSLIGHNHDDRYAPKTHHHNEYALRTHRHNWDDFDGKPNNLATTENVKTAIDGIQIGGRNYYKSSTGFILSNNITLVSRDSNSFSLNNVNRGGLRILNVINENNLWTCSFKARINSGVGKFKLDICDYLDIYFDVTTEFKFFKITEKISNFSNIYNFIDFLFINKGIYEIKDFKIEKGNTPTDWSPAPEDLATTEEVMRKITRTGYEVGTDTVIPQAQQNDTVFVNASCTLGLQNIERLGSVSFLKTFDNGVVTFTCAGKNIIYPFDNTFNGKKGSTAVVSIHNNDCYIRISNV